MQLLDIWSLFNASQDTDSFRYQKKVKCQSEQFAIRKSISFGWFSSAGLGRSSKVGGLPTGPGKDCKDQLPCNRWLKEPFKNLIQGFKAKSLKRIVSKIVWCHLKPLFNIHDCSKVLEDELYKDKDVWVEVVGFSLLCHLPTFHNCPLSSPQNFSPIAFVRENWLYQRFWRTGLAMHATYPLTRTSWIPDKCVALILEYPDLLNRSELSKCLLKQLLAES